MTDPDARKRALLRSLLAAQGLADDSATQERIAPRDQAVPTPLSAAQRRMWLLQQLEPGSAAYNICAAVELTGPLDVTAFRRAVRDACARHEILRTVYPGDTADTAIAVADTALSPELIVLDRTAAPEHGRAVDEIARALGGAPFLLAVEAPLRLRLIRLAADRHVLVLVAHHIAWDDASWQILLRDITDEYAGAPRAAHSVQYGDHAAWAADADTAPELEFWRDRLTPIPEPLALPTDFPRPARPDETGGRCVRRLPAALADAVREGAKRAGVTPFMLLCAAVTAVLHRYTGASDIALGTPVVRRDRAELDGLVGNFGNTVVLRSRVDAAEGFDALLDRTRAVCADAYAYAALPFDRLVAELAPERAAGRSVLFDVLFSVRSEVERGLALPGVRVRDRPVHNGTAQFDLALAAVLTDEELTLDATFRTALFDGETIATLLRHTETLLRTVLADPARPLADLDLLTGGERAKILYGWNATEVPVPATTLPALLAEQVARTPDETAVVFRGRRLSYAEFDRATNRLAHLLTEHGVGPERVVAIALPRSLELVVAIWAVLKAGGAYLPIDPGHPADRIAYVLGDAAPELVLGACPGTGLPVVAVDLDLDGPDHAPPVALDPRHAAYVIYTSGSTGRPKGVVVPHAGIVNRLLWMQDEYGLRTGEPVLQKTPATFDVSVWEFCWPLLAGATLVVAEPDGHRDPEYLARLIDAHGVTTVHFVPSMLGAFLADPAAAGCTGLRRILCSGEALPADLAQSARRILPGAELHNLYGPTEASVDVTAYRARSRTAGTTVPIGHPVWNTAVYVLDRDLRPVPVGVTGELYLAGAQLARAYLDRPGLTATRFVASPFGAPGTRMYRTGDLARFDRTGALEYVGRTDDQVKLRGLRIELGEIESVLAAHGSVRAAAVAVREDVPGSRQLVGYLVGEVDERAVLAHAAAELPDYMVPAALLTVAELPLSPSGKLDRTRLATAAEYAAAPTGAHRAPATDRERLLCELAAAVLSRPEVGVDDRFFAVGGDSIQAISLVSRARAAGLEFTARDVFDHQTPANLAAVARSVRVADLTHDSGTGLVEPTPIMEWLRHRGGPIGRFSQSVLVTVPATDLTVLTAAAQAVLDHHDALRARLVRWADGPWRLDVPEPGVVDAATVLDRVDVTDLPEHAVAAIVDERTRAARDRLDPDTGTMLGLTWLDAGPTVPGRLLCTAHHLVIDAVSWRIVLDDLAQAHTALAAGREPALPVVRTSLRRHAATTAARAEQARSALPRWLDLASRPDGVPVVRPLDPAIDTAARTCHARRTLGAAETAPLLAAVPAALRAATGDVLVSALALAVADWRTRHGGPAPRSPSTWRGTAATARPTCPAPSAGSPPSTRSGSTSARSTSPTRWPVVPPRGRRSAVPSGASPPPGRTARSTACCATSTRPDGRWPTTRHRPSPSTTSAGSARTGATGTWLTRVGRCGRAPTPTCPRRTA